MKTKNKKWLLTTLAVAALSVAATGVAIGNVVTADAEAFTEYYKHWTFTEGAGSYVIEKTDGTKTTITRSAGEDTVGVTYNGALHPLYTPSVGDNGYGGSQILIFPYSSFSSKAVSVTMTSVKNARYQVSLIGTFDGDGYRWRVALTDDIEVKEDGVYAGGGKAVGASDGDTSGYSTEAWVREDPQIALSIDPTSGAVYLAPNASTWARPAILTSQEYLDAALAELPSDSPYRSRYTQTHVANTLSAFSTGGCAMTITYHGMTEDTASFYYNAYTGWTSDGTIYYQWIGNDASKYISAWGSKTFHLQERTTMYKYVTYSLTDLANLYHCNINATPSSVGLTGWTVANADGTASDASWFDTKVNYGASSVTIEDDRSVYYLKLNGNSDGLGKMATGWLYSYDILDSTPVITAKDVEVKKGTTYQLADLFDVFTPLNATPTYTINGESATTWTPSACGETATVVCTVDDTKNPVQTKTITVTTTHTETANAEVAPTCQTTGLTGGAYCSLCDEVLSDATVLPVTAHKDENDDGACDFDCSKSFENAALSAKVTMVAGASVRLSMDGNNGLRFTAKVADYADDDSTSYGMLIAPASYLDTVGAMDFEHLFGEEAVYDWADENGAYNGDKTRIINVTYADLGTDADGDYVIRGSILNIKRNNLTCEFIGVAYVKKGNAYGIASYTEADNVRSIYEVAQAAVNDQTDDAPTQAQKDYIQAEYIDKAVWKVTLPEGATPVSGSVWANGEFSFTLDATGTVKVGDEILIPVGNVYTISDVKSHIIVTVE